MPCSIASDDFNWELHHSTGIFDCYMRDRIPAEVKRIVHRQKPILVAIYGCRSNAVRFLSHYMRLVVEGYPIACMASVSKTYETWVKSRGSSADPAATDIIRDLEKARHLGFYHFDTPTGAAFLRMSDTFKMWWSELIYNRVIHKMPVLIAVKATMKLKNRIKPFMPDGILDDPAVKLTSVDADEIYGGGE